MDPIALGGDDSNGEIHLAPRFYICRYGSDEVQSGLLDTREAR